MKKNMVSRYVATGLVAIGVFMAAGCATVTNDAASPRFPLLEENIKSAKTAGAEVYAPTPLKAAEDRMEAAKSALTVGDKVSADRLVDEAMMDADYARAKAVTEEAKNEVMRLREAIQALRIKIDKMPAAATR